jgi:hypothetical protein
MVFKFDIHNDNPLRFALSITFLSMLAAAESLFKLYLVVEWVSSWTSIVKGIQ